MTGLAANLSNNIIIADGNGVIGVAIDTVVRNMNFGFVNSLSGTGAFAIGSNNTVN